MVISLPVADQALDSTSRVSRARASLTENWVTIVLLALPVVWLMVYAWSRRWTSDDAFINFRIVDQIFEGNGPVYNAGERIEAATSPAWLLLLVVGKVVLFWLPIEWVAALLGLATTAAAVIVAEIAAMRLYRTPKVIPFAILPFVALPPVAEFTTSGLENGLSMLWLAGSQLCLVAAFDHPRHRAPILAATIIGLGPLVRPDVVVMTVVFGVALLVIVRPRTVARFATLAVAALALPLLYQVFRMAYYGALVPNTAFAKEASASYWSQGWKYLADFGETYYLWAPALLLLVAGFVVGRHELTGRWILMATPVVAGLVHGLFVVRGGGDFMHARLLLPSAFAVMLPFAALPIRRATMALGAAALACAMVAVAVGGPAYAGVGPDGITDERSIAAASAPDSDLVRPGHGQLAAKGFRARELARDGERVLEIYFPLRSSTSPLGPDVADDGVLSILAIGQAGYAAGTDVYVSDRLGLADPVGSRLELLTRGRPGHEKQLDAAWVAARWGDPESLPPDIPPARVEAARQALECPDTKALVARAQDPLTISRAARNVVEAITDHGVRIHPDPMVAATCRE